MKIAFKTRGDKMKRMVEINNIIIGKMGLSQKWAIGELAEEKNGAQYFKWKNYIPDDVIEEIKNDGGKIDG